MAEKVRVSSTLDKPYTSISKRDPIFDLIDERGKLIGTFPPHNPSEINGKLEFDGNVIHVYDENMIFVFEVPSEVDLDPHFKRGDIVEVIGEWGQVCWRTAIITVGTNEVVTSCSRHWTKDGKFIDFLGGAHSDLQIRKFFHLAH